MIAAAPIFDNIAPISGPGTACYAFIDVIGIWHKQALTLQQLRWLSSETKPLIKPPFLRRGPARFDPSYLMYTRLRQPSRACLEWLAKREGVKLTYIELARDTIYDDEDQVEAMGQLFNASLVQRRHGNKRTKIFLEGANGSTGVRSPGLSFMWYTTKPSKITGEVNCFHFEARLCGSRSLRRYGIHNPSDLLTFNHGAFWQEMWAKRLVLENFDPARLGRYHDNCVNGTRRRSSTYEDFRRGCLLHRIYGQAGEGGFSIQGVFDRFGRASFIQHDYCLTRPELITIPELSYPPKP